MTSSDGLTERISFFVDTGTLLQPISKLQSHAHTKDATDLIHFIEKKMKKPNVSCFGPRNT